MTLKPMSAVAIGMILGSLIGAQAQLTGPGLPPSEPTYTPIAGSQHNIPLASPVSLIAPPFARFAVVQAANNDVKYSTDGTIPTPTVGMSLYAGTAVKLSGLAVISTFSAIAAGPNATLDVEYYK